MSKKIQVSNGNQCSCSRFSQRTLDWPLRPPPALTVSHGLKAGTLCSHCYQFYNVERYAGRPFFYPSLSARRCRHQLILEIAADMLPTSPDHSLFDACPSHERGDGEIRADEVPESRVHSLLVATGGACIFFCTLGLSNSFGIFEQYYLKHQLSNQSPSVISWIGSLQSFLQFFAGMLGGPLFDSYGSLVRSHLS